MAASRPSDPVASATAATDCDSQPSSAGRSPQTADPMDLLGDVGELEVAENARTRSAAVSIGCPASKARTSPRARCRSISSRPPCSAWSALAPVRRGRAHRWPFWRTSDSPSSPRRGARRLGGRRRRRSARRPGRRRRSGGRRFGRMHDVHPRAAPWVPPDSGRSGGPPAAGERVGRVRDARSRHRRRRLHRQRRRRPVARRRPRGGRRRRSVDRPRRRRSAGRGVPPVADHRARRPARRLEHRRLRPLRREVRSSASRRRSRRCTGATTWSARSRCSTRCAPTGSNASCSPRQPPRTATSPEQPIAEDAPTRPTSPYGATKLADRPGADRLRRATAWPR